MKINFRGGVKTFSGFWDDYVYQSCLNRKICIGRDYTYPEITANNHTMGSIAKNLKIIYRNAAPGYVEDLKTYRHSYKQLKRSRNPFTRIMVPGFYALMIKMMYNWYDSDPEHVDLTTVTIGDIIALDADVKTIARAVEADFLPMIPDYEELTNPIQV